MLDIGWTELLVIAIVLIVVVGPKDLPPMLRAFGKMTSNLRKMAGDFRTQFDEALREADMDDVRQTISDAKNLNPANALRDAINPLRQMGQDIRNDLQKATSVPDAVDTVTKADDPLLSGQEATTETSAVAESHAATPAPAAATASAPAAVSAVAPAAGGAAAAAATPVRKPRAPRKVAAQAEEAPVVAVAPKPKRAAAKPAAPKAAGAKTAAVKAGASKAVSTAEATAAPKKTRAKKAAPPKDEA